jgi:hypothetical protein
MTFTTEQKSQLAKLMATENLTVQHRKMQTAMFDTKNRILYLPIWQNMSGDLYDLLCGHEVGHALYTPDQGWHDAAVDKSKGKNYKGFLNVVEDARIEKKIKRRYPGLRLSFQKGYIELMQKDFFGLEGRDANQLPFIDRLNLFSKSQYTASWIEFNDIESDFVNRAQLTETWDDVIRLTDEIYEYSKTEQSQLQNTNDITQMQYELSDDFDDSDDVEFIDSDEESDQEVETKKTKSKPEEATEQEDEKESDLEEDKILDRKKESTASTDDMVDPVCETDDNYRANETSLLDAKSKDFMYVNIPQPILKNIITPHTIVHQRLEEHYSENSVFAENGLRWTNEFKRKNERYISLLAKEFEMRKAAKSFSKSKISETGDLDINKLSSYKFDDNIFRKVMLTPKGKSHGLVLLLDKSGSMTDNMAGSIEQILVLTMFCRKVNIPFVVYGFGNSTAAKYYDTGMHKYDNCFDVKSNDLDAETVYLREYLNSEMNSATFNRAVRNLVCLKQIFSSRRIHGQYMSIPKSEDLSNTPLTEAIIATATIMKEFKKKNGLDITSLVIVHDGDADHISYKVNDCGGRSHIDCGRNNVYIQDSKSKFEKYFDINKVSLNAIILDWFRKTTDSKVFGFYLGSKRSRCKYAIQDKFVDEDGNSYQESIQKNGYEKTKEKIDVISRKLGKDKFVEMNTNGFDAFYVILGGEDLMTEDEQLVVTDNTSVSKLKSAFMKFNENKSTNRVLVSRFITGMAT